MNDVIYQSIIAFTSQVAFLWARTYNLHTTASLEMRKTLVSGAIIHLLWLVGIAVGANGVYKVMVDYDLRYLPVIVWSLVGSLIGSYIGLKRRIKEVKRNE